MLAASNGTSAKDNTANWNGEMRVISRFIDDALALRLGPQDSFIPYIRGPRRAKDSGREAVG